MSIGPMSEGALRNKPCPCGSGRKYKRCCAGMRKPRDLVVTVDMGEPTRLTGIGITHDNQIEVIQDGRVIQPKEARVEATYERIKGPKILTRASLEVASLALSPNRALEKYDLLYAVDTNTRIIRGERVSVGCIVLAQCELCPPLVQVTMRPMNWLELRNVSGPPENLVWADFIGRVMLNPAYDIRLQIGIVVDSDLGRLPEYNARTAPICDGFFLPANVEFIYASSERSEHEYVPNLLMSIADKQAAHLLREIEAELAQLGELRPAEAGLPYTQWRYGGFESPED
jgi:hypothetical protein